ncbi:MAG: acetyl-CoA carboxylase, carboxyltransferase subunit beta, partial [Mariprofundaceae bacterium]|nr:acetyl-CoA carboxylase, carboxyltransferase subunit beta [Mariprofundaceae bacterium]
MNWITRLIENPKSLLSSKAESNTPEGLWVKCPGCSETLYNKELERANMVCPRCSQHLRIGAEERAKYLFDEGAYDELDGKLRSSDPLNFKDLKRYKDRLKEADKKVGKHDAMRNYLGMIEGIQTSVSIFEFKYMGGSMGSVVGEKIVRGMEHALEHQCPYLLITASGGARMQESLLALMQMSKTAAAANRLKDAKLPFVCLLTDPTMGGVSASVAWLGDVILAEPDALIGFAGPRVIQETVGETLPEGFQRSDFLLEHGLIDGIVDRREQRAYLKTLFTHLTARPYQ